MFLPLPELARFTALVDRIGRDLRLASVMLGGVLSRLVLLARSDAANDAETS